MSSTESNRPIVLEKIQLESRKVFSVNNRRAVIEERRNDRKLFNNELMNGNSFFVKRQKLINELPPHPKKVLLPIIENQFVFLGGVALSLIHKALMSNFGKSMIDFIILRSIFGNGLLIFLLFEIHYLKRRINMLSTTKRYLRDFGSLDSSTNNESNIFASLSKKSKLSLIIWMFISSIFTISQPLVDKFFPIQIISLSQPFTPLISLIILFIFTYKSNKEHHFTKSAKDKMIYTKLGICYNGRSDTSTSVTNFSALESSKITENIKLEAEKLFQRSRMIADNQISYKNLLIIFLSFIALLSATPIKGMLIYFEKTTISFFLCGLIPTLILPCLHEVFFHIICNRILSELLADKIESNPQSNIVFTRISPIDDLNRKLCNIYIHLFMTLGQIMIVLPTCIGIKAIFYLKFSRLISTDGNVSNLNLIGSILESLFDIGKTEIVTIIFSVVSMLGIYQRCKINNAETFGLAGLMSVQGFQTLLSTSLKSSWSTWLNNHLTGLIFSISSIAILRFQDIIGTLKIFYLYARWTLYFNTQVIAGKDERAYEYENIKSYKSNIRIIGGSIDINSNIANLHFVDSKPRLSNQTLMDDEVSLKSDSESENIKSLIEDKTQKTSNGYNIKTISLENKNHDSKTKHNNKFDLKSNSNYFIETPIMSAKVVVLQN
ncbi:unnamed protein product [Cryptosporidium hominis]|uniref:Uncharacterized protein n=1 Tax=Cryptosporidium hominis TaxID=237895 RepID=A0A0S4TDY9_CRYHO|nr:hypothetical protein [Cryptosporidium hominis TU502]OLQ15764.1 putative integral membrane protein [Cryptosporidium hominis]PPA64341.1 hypothetical protein ChUKH1_04205 [Cryptosporidium hominis]PPS96346.1 Uncharacterized protein GY17_00001647 [Cryptosporidium hominis]CUV05566.1 unnamed protein product [Cryptosporidium hominis]|eukprot:PPS96346.1 Uncharacterized protein GY17_00001647 [Cryptosporidium hominis]